MTLIPGIEINALVTRDLGLWEGELHILGFGDGSGRRGVRGRAGRRSATRAGSGSTGPSTLLREIGMPIDAQVAGLDAGRR